MHPKRLESILRLGLKHINVSRLMTQNHYHRISFLYFPIGIIQELNCVIFSQKIS